MSVLAIDIGGTKSALALCTISVGSSVSISNLETLRSSDFHSLLAMIQHWQSLYPGAHFDAIGAGVAGPIVEGKVRLTNLGWDIEAKTISSATGRPFHICNDMESHGWGLLNQTPDQLEILNAGVVRAGAKALIAAGTGLGEAIIGFDGKRHFPMPGEGGHASFSPCSDREIKLLEFLRADQTSHVSWERILGGLDGFRNLANFIAHENKLPLPQYLIQPGKDWGAAIAAAASTGEDFAVQVLALYTELYGREAGNLALKALATGGLYIGGGIAPKIIPWMRQYFMRGFLDKGRFNSVLKNMPVFVIMDKHNGLRGAAMQVFNAQTQGANPSH